MSWKNPRPDWESERSSDAGIHTSSTWKIKYMDVGPFRYQQNQLGPRLIPSLQDDANALVHYGKYGLLDPKAPFVDAPATAKMLGVGYFAGLAVAVGTGFAASAFLGWAIDPQDKRKGGISEWNFDDWNYPLGGPSYSDL